MKKIYFIYFEKKELRKKEIQIRKSLIQKWKDL